MTQPGGDGSGASGASAGERGVLILLSIGLVALMGVRLARPVPVVDETPGALADQLARRPDAARWAPPEIRVDLNLASVDELQLVPGIGPRLAARIVADRDEHGPYATVDALVRVHGVGPVLVARARGHVTVGGAER